MHEPTTESVKVRSWCSWFLACCAWVNFMCLPWIRLNGAIQHVKCFLWSASGQCELTLTLFYLVSVCGSSKLPAAPDEYLVWARDGIHAVACSVEDALHVSALHSHCALPVPLLCDVSRLQGEQEGEIGVCLKVYSVPHFQVNYNGGNLRLWKILFCTLDWYFQLTILALVLGTIEISLINP